MCADSEVNFISTQSSKPNWEAGSESDGLEFESGGGGGRRRRGWWRFGV